MSRDLHIKRIKLANACMNLAKSMAEVNQLLYDTETLHLYTKCPIAQEMGSRHLMTESHEWLMISKWLKQHMIGD